MQDYPRAKLRNGRGMVLASGLFGNKEKCLLEKKKKKMCPFFLAQTFVTGSASAVVDAKVSE